jgi:hypothetical protein
MRIRTLLRISPLALFVIAACAGVEGTDADSADLAPAAAVEARPQTRLTHDLPRNGSSTVSFRTLPHAACTLRPASEAPGAREHLRIYADDDGIARLSVHDTAGALQSGELALDCADEAGQSFTHALTLNVAEGVRGHAPAPYTTAGKRHLAAPEKDPASMNEAEIVAHGYPPRPDARTAPAQHQKWLSLVKSGATLIAPHRISEPSRTHGPVRATVDNASGTSSNWSGYVIATGGSAPQYGEIFGAWPVPRAYAQGGFWHLNYSSFWVGIDGWGTPDVVQAGTDQNTETIFWVQASSYGAWTEWYPLSSQSVSNFSVNPGDNIYCWVWVGNSAGSWTPSGGVGWFYLWNTTQNVATGYLSTAAPSGTVFNGHQAEWVMERPSINGSVSSLANYSSAKMYDAWAYDFSYQTHYYTSDYSVNLAMYNGSHLLSTVAPVDAMTMQFAWHNYN